MSRQLLRERALLYTARRRVKLDFELGSGVQGSVWSLDSDSLFDDNALKIHEDSIAYCRERDVYLRLREYDVRQIGPCVVPRLVDHDDELLALEMTLVERPFVLDFGGAYLDYPPDFSDDVWAEWTREKIELYGDRWPIVQSILKELEGYDIYMIDVNLGNISFE